MEKVVKAQEQIIFLGPRKNLLQGDLPARVSICRDPREVEKLVQDAPKSATWVSFSREYTDTLLHEVIDLGANFREAKLLTLAPPRAESIQALLRFFRLFGPIEGFRWLPKDELVEVMTRDDASGRFLGGSADHRAKTLTLLRGDLNLVVVPFAQFPPSGDGVKPDFARLGVADYGHTIVLGEYEAAADAVLYEVDPGFRRVLNQRRRQTERSFGASLMRLRKQRRLKRSDFGSVSSKEIARIERNEVEKPHASTLEAIAKRLEVRPEEVGSF